MEIFYGILIFAFFVLTFAITFYVNSREEKEEAREKRIDGIFDKLNQKAKPLEKHKVIQDLFVKSSIHVTKAGYNLNTVETAIYGAELAMHIFALYIANRFVNLENKEQRMKYLEGLEFNSWLICIKQFLNLLIENGLKQNKIELEQIKAIVSTRVHLIFHQDDFETRNFDFQNLCNYEIQYEDEKNVFFIGHSEDLRINPGNPLNMLILPSAYKVGLVDEFLEKLKNAD